MSWAEQKMSWAEYAGTRSVGSASSSRAGLGIDIDIVSDLASVESLWRTFQQDASCAPFQTFEWLSAWERTIGAATAAVPAVVTLHRHGRVAAIIPLAFQDRGLVRQITFLGNTLCDYNAPLLAPDFARVLPPRLFLAAWDEIKRRLRKQYRYNLLVLDKLPQRIGGQRTPLWPCRQFAMPPAPTAWRSVRIGMPFMRRSAPRIHAATTRPSAGKWKPTCWLHGGNRQLCPCRMGPDAGGF